ncbi:MAG: HAMP domain-containing sensor histidine kinase [Gemmatimonadaceae bacterium]
MNLNSRLAAGFVAIALILAGPLSFAVWSLFHLKGDSVELRDRDFGGSIALGKLRDGLRDVRHQELALLFSKDTTSRNAMDVQIKRVAALADSLKTFDLKDFARDIGASIREVASAAPAEYKAALAGDTTRADSISSRVFVPALTRADSTVLNAERSLQLRAAELVDSQTSKITQTTTASIIALVLALLIAGSISFWLTRSISGPIDDLESGMSSVAGGYLEYDLKIPNDRTDEFGRLAVSFREMTRQLMELDKLKAEFVSVASHELKTPINVIVGYLQLLDEGVYGPLTPKQTEIHKTVANQAQTLSRLVKQLLDVSRFEAGGGRLEPRQIRLDRLLKELESAFHVLALQREIVFKVDEAPGLPTEVYWDLDRINEVLGNLLSNAFKFTPRGGEVDLTISPDGSNVRVSVRDTGAGIPPEQVPRIFEKFFMADNQSAARAAGSGLGLAIAKGIVEAHRGSISCESMLGAGTTFSITLPPRVPRHSQRVVGVVG